MKSISMDLGLRSDGFHVCQHTQRIAAQDLADA